MNRIAQLLNGETPLIAVGFGDNTNPKVIEDGVKLGLDVAELRIDLYSSFDHEYVLNEVRKFKSLPTVATIRIGDEGGQWNLAEDKRLLLFKAIMKEVDSVDIELQSSEILPQVVQEAHALGKLVFISFHDFEKTPELSYLEQVASRATSLGADAIKVATYARNQKDLQTLASFTIKNSTAKLVTMAMGSEGVVSRLFFPALGSKLTYAYIGKPSAPGQLTFQDTFYLLRKLYPDFNQKKINSLELMECV